MENARPTGALTALTTTFLLSAGLGMACGSAPGAKGSPVEEASYVIGESGGIVMTPDGSSVSVPKGALTHSVRISIESDSSAPPLADATLVGLDYLVGPEGQQFDAPVTVTVAIDPSEIPAGESMSDVVVLTAPRDSADYQPLTTTVVDDLHVSVETSHFSHFVPAIVREHATDALADMLGHFFTDDRFDDTSYWTNAQALDAVLDGVERTKGKKYTEYVDRIVQANEKAFGGWFEPAYREVYFDDIAWMALALIRAHDDAVTYHFGRADAYLEAAAQLVDYTIDHGQSGSEGPSYMKGSFAGLWWNSDHGDQGPHDACSKQITVEFSVAIGAGGLAKYADAHANGCWSVLDADPGDPASDFRICSREGAPVQHKDRPNYGYDDTNPEHALSADKADLAACAKGATGIGFEYMAYRGGWRLLPANHLNAYIAELQMGDDDVDGYWPGAYVGNRQLEGHRVYPMINISPGDAKQKIEEDGPAICRTIDDGGYLGVYVGNWMTTKIPDDDPRIEALGKVLDACTKRSSPAPSGKDYKKKVTAANFASVIAAARLSERRSELTDKEIRKRGLGSLRAASTYTSFALKVYDYWYKTMVKTSCAYTGAWVYDSLVLKSKDGAETWEASADDFTYDQGIGIGAALAVAAIDLPSEKGVHLAEARAMADYLVAHETQGDVLHDKDVRVKDHELTGCKGSCEGFKGIAYRYLLELYRETNVMKYYDVLHSSAHAVFAKAYDKREKLFGTSWSHPVADQAYFGYPDHSNRGGQRDLAANASAVMAYEMFANPTLDRTPRAAWDPAKTCGSPSPPPPPDDGGGGTCTGGSSGCIEHSGSGTTAVCNYNWSTFPGFVCSDDPGYSAGSCATEGLYGCCVTTTLSPTSSGTVTTTEALCYYDASVGAAAQTACHGGTGDTTISWSTCPP
jgi:predicted alpha-1,6-mannanase (GH76 family)